MPRYRIFLHDGRNVIVEGDKIEIVDQPTVTAASGDVLVRKARRVVAHYSAHEMVAYIEVEPGSSDR